MVSLVAGSVFAWGQGKGQRMGVDYNQNCCFLVNTIIISK
jgi:hypothetical protein